MSIFLLLVLFDSVITESTGHSKDSSARTSSYLTTATAVIERNVQAIVNRLAVAKEQLEDITQSQKLEAELTLPKECQTMLENGREVAISNFGQCNLMYILTNTVVVVVDSVRFFVTLSVDTAVIMAEAMGCTGSFNPIVIIQCIIKAFTTFPKQIREIFDEFDDFKDVLEYFVPKIFQTIESCFNRTVSDYVTLVNNTLDNPQICAK